DHTDAILKRAFENKDEFRTSWRCSFEFFINQNQTRMAELLARYVDRKLRGEKGVSEAETETALDKLLLLFRHLQGKDLFEAFYKKHLAKRLLLGKSASSDNEKSMIGRMRL
ncbi:culD, partial [Symbiodinium microadriaticum]